MDAIDGLIIFAALITIGMAVFFYWIYPRPVESPPMRGRGVVDALATQRQFDEYQQSALKHIRNHSLHDEKPQYRFTHSDNGNFKFECDEWPEVIGD